MVSAAFTFADAGISHILASIFCQLDEASGFGLV